MSGRQPERGRGRGRGGADYRGRGRGRGESGQSDRGPGSQYQVSTFESRGGRGNRADQGGFGRGGRGSFGRGGRGGGMGIEVFSHDTGGVPPPDVQVRKVENETARAVQVKGTAGSKKTLIEPRMPPRPGYGTQGKEVILWANYFEMIAPMELILFRYSVEIRAMEAGRKPAGKKVKRIVELLIEEHFPQYLHSIATDYKSNLICRSALPIEEDEYRVLYRAEGEDDPSPAAQTYLLHLHGTGTLAVSELMDYLTSSQASALFGSKDEIIQALNIIMGHYPKTVPQVFSVGANKHFALAPAPSEHMSLGSGLEAIRGFFVSVRSATSRILLNIQVKHTACYEEGPLARLMSVYLAQNRGDLVGLGKFLNKVRVRITHIVRRNRGGHEISRIKAITSLATPNDGNGLQYPPRVPRFAAGSKEVEFFLNDSGEQQPGGSQQSPVSKKGKKGKKPIKEGPEPIGGRYISVYDFFKNTYQITIRDPDLPVINVNNRQKPSYLPPDVCQVEAGQASGAKLTPSQTQQMIRFAVRRPRENARSIVMDGARLMGIEPATNTTLSEFEIAITPRLITVPGRVLTGPNVRYKDGKPARTVAGSWNMNEVELSTRSRLSSWTYLLLAPMNSQVAWNSDQELQHTLDAFQNKLRRVGVDVTGFTAGLRVNFNPANVEAEIDAAIHRFVSHPTRPAPKLLLVIIPYISSPIYNRVKFVCDVKVGLLNVCTLGTKFAKANDQYYANVALKFNLKLGGRNQYLDNAKLGVIAEGKTMVVGIDVTHPSPGSASNAPSVAGIVASIDQWLGQWPADLRIQPARQEMVSGLDAMLKSRLPLWAKRNKGALPENILIYRDGVSEGQYDIVLDEELPLLRRACTETYPGPDTQRGLPRISIIIVGKRHNTRFYATRDADADRSCNPQNGTVVDRGVTEARHWDFYLQAHAALQGTARPAHYFTVLDEIFQARKTQAPPFQSAADALEDLTHNLCYLFGRATKAVSICPPAYYADLVCERARCYLGRLFEGSQGATPGGSVSEGGGGGGGGAALEPDESQVRIHENVRDSMFYI